MNFLSLFAGIGGIDLGLERAGMRCVGQVEIDPFCRRVLAKHWPDVPKFDDVRTFTKDSISERIDLIAGGFPCQDISNAGHKLGLDGARSGLWGEYRRIIREVRPRFVLVENVAALLVRGIDRVLGDLATLGFDAEWSVLSACALGAPHTRERVFIIAHANGGELRTPRTSKDQAWSTGLHKCCASEAGRVENWWAMEPEPCSVAYGLPGIVDQLRPFGNVVVPQVAEFIGRAILAAEGVAS